MATLTRQTIAAAGSAFTPAAADAGGDDVTYANGQYLLVKNDDMSSHTVTITSEFTASVGAAASDNAVTIAAGELAVIPLSSVYKNSSTSKVSWTYDAVTSLTVAVI